MFLISKLFDYWWCRFDVVGDNSGAIAVDAAVVGGVRVFPLGGHCCFGSFFVRLFL